jgi:hypothetical protein
MQLPLRVACKSHSRCTGVCVSSLDDVKVGVHGRTVSCMEGDSQQWNSLGDTVIPIGTSTHRIDVDINSADVLTHLCANNHRTHSPGCMQQRREVMCYLRPQSHSLLPWASLLRTALREERSLVH